MRIYQNEFYIIKSYAFYDSQITSVIGAMPVAVYEILRKYIWRSTKKGKEFLTKLVKDGYLPAYIGQETIASDLGLSRKTVGKCISTLEKIGWIQTRKGTNNKLIYILGKVTNSGAARHELLYADGFLSLVWDRLTQKALIQDKEGPEQLPRKERKLEVINIIKELFPSFDDFVTSEEDVVDAVEGGEAEDSYDDLEDSKSTKLLDNLDGARKNFPNHSERFTQPVVTQSSNSWHSLPQHAAKNLPTEVYKREVENKIKVEKENIAGGIFLAGVEKKTPKVDLGFTSPDPAKDKENSALDRLAALKIAEQTGLDKTAEFRAKRQAKIEKSRVSEQRKDNLQGSNQPIAESKKVKQLEDLWKELMQEHFPGLPIGVWMHKEKNAAKEALASYGWDLELIKAASTYLFKIWGTKYSRWKNASSCPTITFLKEFKSTVIPDSIAEGKAAEAVDVQKEIDAWYENNPNKRMPDELRAKFDELMKK